MRTKEREKYLQNLSKKFTISIFDKIQDEIISLMKEEGIAGGDFICFQINCFAILSGVLFNRHIKILKAAEVEFNHLKELAEYLSQIESVALNVDVTLIREDGIN